MKRDVHTKTYIAMFIAGLFVLVPKPETLQRSMWQWMDIQIMIYSHNGALISNIKDRTNSCNNLDEFPNHDAEDKKPDTEECILWFYWYKSLEK